MFASGRLRFGKRTTPGQDTDPEDPIDDVDTPDNPVVVDPGGDIGGPGGGDGGFFPNDPDDDDPDTGTVPGVGPVVRPEPGDATPDTSPPSTNIHRRRVVTATPVTQQYVGAFYKQTRDAAGAVTSSEIGGVAHSPDGSAWTLIENAVDLVGVKRMVGTPEWVYALIGEGATGRIIRSNDGFRTEAELFPGFVSPVDIEFMPSVDSGQGLLVAVGNGVLSYSDSGAPWTVPVSLPGAPIACRRIGEFIGVLCRVTGGYQVFLWNTEQTDTTEVFEDPVEMRALAGYLRASEVSGTTPDLNIDFFDGDELNDLDAAGWKLEDGTLLTGTDEETWMGMLDDELELTTAKAVQGFPLPQAVRDGLPNSYVRATVRLKTPAGRKLKLAVDYLNQSLDVMQTSFLAGDLSTDLALEDRGQAYLTDNGELSFEPAGSVVTAGDFTLTTEETALEVGMTLGVTALPSGVPGKDIRHLQASGAAWTSNTSLSPSNQNANTRLQFYENGTRTRSITMSWRGGSSASAEGGILFPSHQNSDALFTLQKFAIPDVVHNIPVRMHFGVPTNATLKLYGGFGRRGSTNLSVRIVAVDGVAASAATNAKAYIKSANNLPDFVIDQNNNRAYRTLASNGVDISTPWLLELRGCTYVDITFQCSDSGVGRISCDRSPWGSLGSFDTYPSDGSIPIGGHNVAITSGPNSWTGTLPSNSDNFLQVLSGPGGDLELRYDGADTLADTYPSGTTSVPVTDIARNVRAVVEAGNRTFKGTFPGDDGPQSVDLVADPTDAGHPGGELIGFSYAGAADFLATYTLATTKNVRVNHTDIDEGTIVNVTSSTPTAYSDAIGQFPASDLAYGRVRLGFEEGVQLSSVLLTGVFPDGYSPTGYITIGGDWMNVWTVRLDPNSTDPDIGVWTDREQYFDSTDAPIVDMATIDQTEGSIAVSLTPGKLSAAPFHFSDDGRTWRHGGAGVGPMLFTVQAGKFLFTGSMQDGYGLSVGAAPGTMTAITAMPPIRTLTHGFMQPSLPPLPPIQVLDEYEGQLGDAPEWATFNGGILQEAYDETLTYRIIEAVEEVS